MYKVTTIFRALSGASLGFTGSAGQRLGGWSESWYNDGTIAFIKEELNADDGLGARRARLLPTGFNIVGFRIQSVVPKGGTLAHRKIWTGKQSVESDIPQMALEVRVAGVDVANERFWLMRGIPDGNVREGEFRDNNNYHAELGTFLTYLTGKGWKFKAKAIDANPKAIQSIAANAIVTTVLAHGIAPNTKVRILRGTSSTKLPPLRGSFTVKSAPTTFTLELNVTAAQPSLGGSLVTDEVIYPTVDGINSDLVKIVTRKVGRPSDQYSGRASKLDATPECSTCGYAIDWLRSCYSSRWRLFRDSEALTRGRYVFADEDTPFYPDFHNVGSAIWTTDDFTNPPLGEQTDPDIPRPWFAGTFPIPKPPARIVGDADCIRNGERLPLPVVPGRTLIEGIDSRCWPIPPQTSEGGIVLNSETTQHPREDAEAGVGIGSETTNPNPEATAGMEVGFETTEEDNSTSKAGMRVGSFASEPMGEDAEGGIRVGGVATEPLPYFGCPSCSDGTWETWGFSAVGGTDDFAPLNGDYVIAASFACVWLRTSGPTGTSAGMILGGSPAMALGIALGGVSAEYGATLDCEGPVAFSLLSSVGSGTPPASITVIGIS